MTNIEAEALLTAEFIKCGKIILYPTDTIWGIGCSALLPASVQKIAEIKKRPLEKKFVLLVNSIEMLKNYISGVHPRVETLHTFHQKPMTVIYPKSKNLDPSICGDDGSIAIRICNDPFCNKLIEYLDAPLVSSSANISGEKSPNHFGEISSEIIQAVDYVVQHRQSERTIHKPSVIVSYDQNGEIYLIRE